MRPLDTNSFLPSTNVSWPSLHLTEKETGGQRVGSRLQLELAGLPGQVPRAPHPHLQLPLQPEWRGTWTRARHRDLEAMGWFSGVTFFLPERDCLPPRTVPNPPSKAGLQSGKGKEGPLWRNPAPIRHPRVRTNKEGSFPPHPPRVHACTCKHRCQRPAESDLPEARETGGCK